MVNRSKPSIVSREDFTIKDTPPVSLRFNRKRLVCGLYAKTRITIEIYNAPKPNVLLNMDNIGDWTAFDSLEDLFKYLMNNYLIKD